MSKRPNTKAIDRRRALDTTLPCQELMESGLSKKTGDIPEGFMPQENLSRNTILSKEVEDDWFTWFYSFILVNLQMIWMMTSA